MKTVRIVLDKELLRATDRAARRTNQNRSQFVRNVLREYLQRLNIRLNEERYRTGYATRPQNSDTSLEWEEEVVWTSEAKKAF